MSVNLLDLAKGYLTDAVVEKASSFLGTSAESTQSGLAHAMPALLGGLMGKAGTSSGASDLLGLITKPELGGGMLDNIGDLFGGGNSMLTNLGGTLLNSVLGDKLGGITDLIGKATGLNSGASSGLLKMAMPLLMGVVSKQVGKSGLSGLTSLLGGQKDYLEKAAPSGFMDKILGSLGIGSLGGLVGNVNNIAGNLTSSASNAAKYAASSVGNAAGDLGKGVKKGGNKMLPFLGILALLAIAYFAFRGCDTDKTLDSVVDGVKSGTEKVVDVAKDGANAVKDGVNTAGDVIVDGANSIYSAGSDLVGKTVEGFEHLGAFASRKLSDGTELIIPNKGFEYQLVDFIESNKAIDKGAWYDMRRVLFDTGSANLDERSMGQIQNVANILKSYPNVNLKLGGYTDNTGNAAANKTLSANRAASVMKALIEKGVDASRLSAEGYGIEHPIASNDTEEGRQLNRRVSARVTKK